MPSSTLAEQCEAIWPIGWVSGAHGAVHSDNQRWLFHVSVVPETSGPLCSVWLNGSCLGTRDLRSGLELVQKSLWERENPPVPGILPLDLHGILKQALRGWALGTHASGATVYNWRDLRVTLAGTARLNLWCDHGARHVRSADLPPDVTQQSVSEALAKLLAFPRYP